MSCHTQCRITPQMPTRRKNPESVREEAVNVLLAQLLRGHGLSARAERRGRTGAPDIRVQLKSDDTIILECKWEGSTGLLESQLEERLENFPDAVGMVGILYPERLRYAEDTNASLLSTDDLQWWLHGSRGEVSPSRHIRQGSVADLADQLRTLPLELEGVDRVAAAANAIGYALEQTAGNISKHARIRRNIADIIAKTDQEKDKAAALRIGCLVLFNALAFQDRLASVNEDVPTVGEISRLGITGLKDAWREICVNIDYVPVFQLAADIADFLIDWPDSDPVSVIAPLIKAVEDTRKLEGHDLSGRLFHTLLSDAKFTGAYYTSVPAATLLSRLVFHNWPPHVDWADHEFPASLNIADLACGTGTLLMAVAAEAERRHEDAGGRNAVLLHKAMVEQALHGYDVQLSAVHFAATSLAMLNPNIQFHHMNLHVMPLGVQTSTVNLGSLDFLGRDEVPVQHRLGGQGMGMDIAEPQRVTGTGTKGAKDGVIARLPGLDLAIMNPPFTRSSLMFGSLSKNERQSIQKELRKRLKSRRASALAGMGAAFVAAASPKLRPGEGRLALVLPITVCTGRSWEQTRSLIEKDFVLDMVISSHDPTRWNFSDSTELSEALLVATRRSEESDNEAQRITFINLWQNPTSVLDAHRVASAAVTTIPAKLEEPGTALLEVDESHIGEALSIPESIVASKKWLGVQFARADLTRSAVKLVCDAEVQVPSMQQAVQVPLCRLDALGKLGPDRRDILDGFQHTDTTTAYPLVEGHDTEQRRRLIVVPDRYLAPLAKARPGRRLKKPTQLWQKASRLLISERLWLETTRVVAMWSEVRVLSNVWWEVKLESTLVAEKALAVWLNSSLGILSILSQRTSTRGGWVAMKKADLEDLPILDPRRLSPSQLQALSDLFDELAEAEFERLPAMVHCPARRALDDGLSKILGLPDLAKLRELLASEPVVSNRPL